MNIKILPIQFAFPVQKLPVFNSEKKNLFSDLSPLGKAKKYRFFIESEYYRHYSQSYFAVTMRKAGWDCLRHYEILASGTLPYFIDIEQCPQDTLFAWPKDLLVKIKEIPGIPKEREVRKALYKGKLDLLKPSRDFDKDEYGRLHATMQEIFMERLTTSALCDYFLKQIGLENGGKILVVFGVVGTALDYCRDSLICALGGNKHVQLVTYPYPYWHSNRCHKSILNTLYGKGFTCTANLNDTQMGSNLEWSEISEKLDTYDAIVACSSSNLGFESLPPEVKYTLNNRCDIIWVDGNDIKGDHTVPSCAKIVFRREL